MPPSNADTQLIHANLTEDLSFDPTGGTTRHSLDTGPGTDANETHDDDHTYRPIRFSKRPIFGKGPKALQGALKEGENVSGPPPKPTGGPMAVATLPEWNIYWALTFRLHKKDGSDFVYRKTAGLLASLTEKTQLDFMLLDGSAIAIEVQGLYWHYEKGRTKVADDIIRAAMLAGKWTIINIDEDAALRDPLFYTKEALEGRDHSYKFTNAFYKPLTTQMN